MKKTKLNIPVYGINEFRHLKDYNRHFQVEIFDANRHFQIVYPHRHDFYEILYLSNGTGIHIIDNNKYTIQPPCIFFMSPGQTHKLELSNDIEGYIFLFSADFYLVNQQNKNRLISFPFFFSIIQQNPPLYLKNQNDNKFISNLFERGCLELQKQNYSEEIIRSLLDLILLTCNDLYPSEYGTIPNKKGHILVKKFLLLIEENYQSNLRVNDYAEKLAITPNHLTQLVKEITGKTTIDIIYEKKIVEIKRLLLHTNLTINEISEKLNFEDQSYFTKYFKKKTGLSPKIFRQKSMKST